ncbi:MAG: heparinase II/III family protein [Bacteroidales bacterium]
MKFLSLKTVLSLSIFVLFLNSEAKEKRNLLQNSTDTSELKILLLSPEEWVKYPQYTNRSGWDALLGSYKDEVIKQGEEALNYEWKVVKATDYLEFGRSGNRNIMQDPFNDNTSTLKALVLAELAEGKGRFIDQISNGVWQACEMTTWALSAHIASAQSKKTPLPSHKENIIDLTVGDFGSLLTWTYYFLHNEIAKVQPLISERLRENIQTRVLDPYMNRSDFWWQALNAKPNAMVNNWNPWCNFNVLTCFLLLEKDKHRLAEAVYRSMRSVDMFINYNNLDGACEEGPSYWGHAAGKLYDYLQILYYSTGGKISLFDQTIIRNMGEYIANSYIGDSWVVNFADASARGGGDADLIFRYGNAVNSSAMKGFGAYLHQRDKNKSPSKGRDLFRTLEGFYYLDKLKKETPSLVTKSPIWYSETEVCYMRSESGFFFAAKGGYNNESHNHNDVGSFLLFSDEQPLFIDAGVGTYTRQTFSSERYSIWTMQSNYHNLPLINGEAQKYGRKYRSGDVVFNAKKNQFSLDISRAYPETAHVNSWQRSYTLKTDGSMLIQDKFKLNKLTQANQLHFLTLLKPDINTAGEIVLQNEKQSSLINFDTKLFDIKVETVPQTDPRLSKVWGENLYLLILTAKKQELQGVYKIEVSKK